MFKPVHIKTETILKKSKRRLTQIITMKIGEKKIPIYSKSKVKKFWIKDIIVRKVITHELYDSNVEPHDEL